MNETTRYLVALIAGMPLMLGSLSLRAQSSAEFVPVTDAMLQNPQPADWLNWRRTLDGWGYSPLDEINTENVGGLRLAWSWAMSAEGRPETNPLVYDGVMYIASPPGVVEALDAVTGELRWRYRHEHEVDLQGIVTTRNLAIYDDKVYLTTFDAHIVALDALTGTVVWNVVGADPALGFKYSAGPIVVRGKVIASTNGCDRFYEAREAPCFISARDAQTGDELWRTSTVARPGEPGGDTWGDTPLMFRIGGDSWTAGSYDPGTDLIYWATAQASRGRAFSEGIPGMRCIPTACWPLTRTPVRSCGTTSSCRARRTTWTRPSRIYWSIITAGDPCSRWASWGFSGSSTGPPASFWPRTISGTKRFSTCIRGPARSPIGPA